MSGLTPSVLVLAGTVPIEAVDAIANATRLLIERFSEVVTRDHVAAAPRVPETIWTAHFATPAAAREAFETITAHATGDDAALDVYLVTETVIFERPLPGVPRRRLSILRRRADLSPSAFRDHWQHVHAPLVTVHRGVSRYAQYAVHDHRVLLGGGVPIDGFGEFLVVDAEAMRRGYTSDAGRPMVADAAQFLASSTTFYLAPIAIGRNET